MPFLPERGAESGIGGPKSLRAHERDHFLHERPHRRSDGNPCRLDGVPGALVLIPQRAVDHLPKACAQSYVSQPFANRKAATFLYVLWFAVSWLYHPFTVSIGIPTKMRLVPSRRPAHGHQTCHCCPLKREKSRNPVSLLPDSFQGRFSHPSPSSAFPAFRLCVRGIAPAGCSPASTNTGPMAFAAQADHGQLQSGILAVDLGLRGSGQTLTLNALTAPNRPSIPQSDSRSIKPAAGGCKYLERLKLPDDCHSYESIGA
jgi:hypothetical protein